MSSEPPLTIGIVPQLLTESTSQHDTTATTPITSNSSTNTKLIQSKSSELNKNPQKHKLSLDDNDNNDHEFSSQNRPKKKKTTLTSLIFDDDAFGDIVDDQALVSLLNIFKQPLTENGSITDPSVIALDTINNTQDDSLKFMTNKMSKKIKESVKAKLELEWNAKQQEIKTQPLLVIFSWWTGTGNRLEVQVKKGDTIRHFLHAAYKIAREQLGSDAVRKVQPDNLIYIKEDLILPNHYTFYDFIAINARGKSGSLVDFGFNEDIRLIDDSRIESTEVHVGKVMDRALYFQNKDVHPYNRFEEYDPKKDYGKYKIA